MTAAVHAVSRAGRPLAPAPPSRSGSLQQPDVAEAIYLALQGFDSMFMVLDLCGGALRIVAMNEETSRVTGYDAAELIDRDLAMLTGPQTDETVFAALLEAAGHGTSYRNQLRLHSRSGAPFWFGLHLIPAGSNGASRHYVIIGRDITAKLLQEQQNNAVQNLLAKVFTIVDVAVYILDMGGRVMMTNPAAERLFGVAAGALNGTNIIDRFVPADHAALLAARARQDRDQAGYEIDATLLGAGGAEIASRCTCALVERQDLRRFRIVSVRPAAPSTPPLRISAAGCVQLIGLQEVRQALGARWAALKERAMATAEHVLRKHLGPGDTFSRTTDEGFIICFVDATEEQASFRAAAIGSEVRRKLIGDGEPPQVAQVFATGTTVPSDTPQLGPAPFAALVQDRVQQRLHGIQATARARLTEALQDSTYAVQEVLARGRTGRMGRLVSLPQATERAIDAALGVLPYEETGDLDTDTMLLGFAHECALAAKLEATSQLVFVTLSADVLTTPRRLEACIAALRAMGEGARQQLVVLVTAQSADAAYGLTDVLPRLRPLCRLAGITVDTLDNEAIETRMPGLTLIMVDAPEGRASTEWEAKLKLRAGTLSARKCRLMIQGAEPSAVARMFALGADFVAVGG